MATAQQIIALLSSHNQGDEEQFLAIALQVAANEARRGRREVADELRRLVDAARQNKVPHAHRISGGAPANVAISISRPRGELQNLLVATYPKNHRRCRLFGQTCGRAWIGWWTSNGSGTACASTAKLPVRACCSSDRRARARRLLRLRSRASYICRYSRSVSTP